MLTLVLITALPLGALAPACSATHTSTAGQMISCTDTATGPVNCHPSSGAAGSGSDTCEDIDDDGDGLPHDVGEEHRSVHSANANDDDDDDGIQNGRDCDHRHGGDDDGDDDGSGHDGSGDGSGSGSGSGSGDGSGHT